jgi:protein SCO1/2
MRNIDSLFGRLTFVFAILLSLSASARALDSQELMGISFEQKLGAFVPANVRFLDDHGNEITLGDLFGTRPLILVLGYYQCPMLCTLMGNGLVGALSGMNSEPGKAFDIVWISIDPKETSQMAALKKETCLRHYGRSTGDGWHFLTGTEPSIRKVADTVGFTYRYDPEIQQYAHPSGIVVLTPRGQVSKYLLGINYPPETLQEAVSNAASTKIGSLTNPLLLLCYHFSPIVGKYGWLIVWIVRGLGVATVLCIAGTVIYLARRERKEESA